MDNIKKFNIYDEEPSKQTEEVSVLKIEDDNLLEIDLSKPETLFTMSKKVRDYLKDKPDDFKLNLYLVCGNVVSEDAGLFADYLKSLTQPILIAFRGVIHFDFIHIFITNTVYLNNNSTILYSKYKLHDTLKNLLSSPVSYKRFIQRFIDEYWKYNEGNTMNISELDVLGIKIEKL